MLKAENVTVRYGEHTIVDNLTFHLEEGQWLMLAGPNGAGKSTLINAVSQGAPYTGSITLAGMLPVLLSVICRGHTPRCWSGWWLPMPNRRWAMARMAIRSVHKT